MAIQILDKIDFKTKIVTRDKENHFIMIKVSIYFIYIYLLTTESKVYKQKLTEFKGDVNNSTIIVGNRTSIMDVTIRQKSNKEREALNNTINHLNLTITECFTEQQQNTHSSQVYMKHSPVYTLC